MLTGLSKEEAKEFLNKYKDKLKAYESKVPKGGRVEYTAVKEILDPLETLAQGATEINKYDYNYFWWKLKSLIDIAGQHLQNKIITQDEYNELMTLQAEILGKAEKRIIISIEEVENFVANYKVALENYKDIESIKLKGSRGTAMYAPVMLGALEALTKGKPFDTKKYTGGLGGIKVISEDPHTVFKQEFESVKSRVKDDLDNNRITAELHDNLLKGMKTIIDNPQVLSDYKNKVTTAEKNDIKPEVFPTASKPPAALTGLSKEEAQEFLKKYKDKLEDYDKKIRTKQKRSEFEIVNNILGALSDIAQGTKTASDPNDILAKQLEFFIESAHTHLIKNHIEQTEYEELEALKTEIQRKIEKPIVISIDEVEDFVAQYEKALKKYQEITKDKKYGTRKSFQYVPIMLEALEALTKDTPYDPEKYGGGMSGLKSMPNDPHTFFKKAFKMFQSEVKTDLEKKLITPEFYDELLRGMKTIADNPQVLSDYKNKVTTAEKNDIKPEVFKPTAPKPPAVSPPSASPPAASPPAASKPEVSNLAPEIPVVAPKKEAVDIKPSEVPMPPDSKKKAEPRNLLSIFLSQLTSVIDNTIKFFQDWFMRTTKDPNKPEVDNEIEELKSKLRDKQKGFVKEVEDLEKKVDSRIRPDFKQYELDILRDALEKNVSQEQQNDIIKEAKTRFTNP